MFDYQPVFLIGAARSGTKILRDVIAQHPAVDKVPFDINYVWRLGNEHLPHDEFAIEQLTPEIRERITKNINRFHEGSPVLIEKTVSNCLRIPFVAATYPNAKFIHLLRHGEDVVESVYRQWNAPPGWRYIIEKARTYPLLETPGYALRYIRDTILRSTQKDKNKNAIWGPAYQGIQQDLLDLDLWQVCAIQWAKSVEKAFQGLSLIAPEKVLSIRYENFVQTPEVWLGKIADFLAIDGQTYQDQANFNEITTQNIGKAHKIVTPQQRLMVRSHLQTVMELSEYSFYP